MGQLDIHPSSFLVVMTPVVLEGNLKRIATGQFKYCFIFPSHIPWVSKVLLALAVLSNWNIIFILSSLV